jgi:hypothetical protein
MAVTAAARPARPARWPGVLAWSVWTLMMLTIAAVGVSDQFLRDMGRPDLVQMGGETTPPVLAAVSAATVGAVLATRRPRHPVGWLLLGIALSLGLTAVVAQYLVYALLARPGTLPGTRYALVYYPACVLAGLGMVGFVMLLTPTGSLPPGRGWRWWARLMGAVPVLLLGVVTLAGGSPRTSYREIGSPLDLNRFTGVVLVANQLALALTILGVGVAAGSFVRRFQRARGVERQQLRWVALAAAIVVLGGVVGLAALSLGATMMLGWAIGVAMMALPVAIGAAVLRYRLYDLDRIVSRTLVYGLLTMLLGGGYVALVLGLGQLVGRDSSLVVAGATLAVAAAFQPVRRRVQRAVDRRFNRRRHDAAQTIEAFSSHLREELDLDTLSAELLSVVDQTMQPTTTSLWLRPSHQPSRLARGHPRTRDSSA